MKITLITPTRPACYGVECPKHQNCKRYALVNNAPRDQVFIGTCVDGAGERPLFVDDTVFLIHPDGEYAL